jgi:hypothetical protein
MFDVADMATSNFRKAVEFWRVLPGQLQFVCRDFATLTQADIPDSYDVLYSQRAIHYICYVEARSLLRLLFEKMASGGRAYVSAAGFDTGKSYPERGKPVQERFAQISSAMQKEHGITQPIVITLRRRWPIYLKMQGFPT